MLFASGGWVGRDAATAASGEDFGEEGGEEEAIGVRGLLDARASALRFLIGNRLVAPEPVDNARLFEARKRLNDAIFAEAGSLHDGVKRSEEHTSELQSLMRISYAVFCLNKKQHGKTT